MKEIGYTKPLFILAFDHRASFSRDLLGAPQEPPIAKIQELKNIIFSGFKLAIADSIPKGEAAILIDEQYGSAILDEAGKMGINFILSVEASGQAEFFLEYGNNFAEHIAKFKPSFVKALVRYNPEGDSVVNKNQLAKLKKFSDWCLVTPYKFLVELLVPATDGQLSGVKSNKARYDIELRPKLTSMALREMLAAGILADVWKIEGMDKTQSYQELSDIIKSNYQENVNMVVLGRGQDAKHMEGWLEAAKGVQSVIGFAIGRTIFWEPLKSYLHGELSAPDASSTIAENYIHFYKFFTDK